MFCTNSRTIKIQVSQDQACTYAALKRTMHHITSQVDSTLTDGPPDRDRLVGARALQPREGAVKRLRSFRVRDPNFIHCG